MNIQTYSENNRSIVGQAVSGVLGISDGGRYQFFNNGVIYKHDRKGTLGFIPKGPILETWWQSGYEHGYLGYPISAAERNIQTNNIPFEGGRLITTASSGTFSVLFYNTQLITLAYNGRGRTRQLNRLIEVLRSNSQDIICLSEVFDDDERNKIAAYLHSTHPYRVDAPDDSNIFRGGLLEDGGLMMLSKHPIIQADELVFRVNAGEDHFANKGVIHARIAINGQRYAPNLVDVYVTHLQAGHETEKQAQAKIAASFIAAKSLKKVPAIFVGDYNINFNATNAGHLFNYPIDAWSTHQLFLPEILKNNGITSDEIRTYESGTIPVNDNRRGVNGGRIDAILKYPSALTSFSTRKVEVKRYELIPDSGIDLSDHYGIQHFGHLKSVHLGFNRNIVIRGITMHLSKLHCLQTTSGGGDDEIKILFRVSINGQLQTESPYVDLGDMDDGDEKNISNRALSFYSSEASGITQIKCSVRVKELDDWSADDLVGDVELELSKEELLLWAKHNASDTRYNVRHPIAVPLMRGDDSRYVAYLTYDLDTFIS